MKKKLIKKAKITDFFLEKEAASEKVGSHTESKTVF
jgi:hypothetical protein